LPSRSPASYSLKRGGNETGKIFQHKKKQKHHGCTEEERIENEITNISHQQSPHPQPRNRKERDRAMGEIRTFWLQSKQGMV
jgi:hypothetical protein